MQAHSVSGHSAGLNSIPYAFQGQENEDYLGATGVGIHNFNARFFDGDLGIFTAVDSLSSGFVIPLFEICHLEYLS